MPVGSTRIGRISVQDQHYGSLYPQHVELATDAGFSLALALPALPFSLAPFARPHPSPSSPTPLKRQVLWTRPMRAQSRIPRLGPLQLLMPSPPDPTFASTRKPCLQGYSVTQALCRPTHCKRTPKLPPPECQCAPHARSQVPFRTEAVSCPMPNRNPPTN